MKKLICISLILLCLCGCVTQLPVEEQPTPAVNMAKTGTSDPIQTEEPAAEETAPAAAEEEVTCGKGVPYGICFETPEDYELFCSLAALSDEEMREKLREQNLSWPFYDKEEYDAFAADLAVMPLPDIMLESDAIISFSYWDWMDYSLYMLDWDLGWCVRIFRQELPEDMEPETLKVITDGVEGFACDQYLLMYKNGLLIQIECFDCTYEEALAFAETLRFCTFAEIFK